MGTDISDPIGGPRPPPALHKSKTISGPYQSYQIRVSVSTLAELQSLDPGVNGAPVFFRDTLLPWYWFETLPAGLTVSPAGSMSTGAVLARPGGYWVSLGALLTLTNVTAAALVFDSVLLASAKRLVDVSLSFIATLLPNVTSVYAKTIRDSYYWDPTSTLPHDPIGLTVIAPTVIGVGPGRFIRRLVFDPYWMLVQHNWYVRPTTGGNNEFDGATNATAVADPEEIQRRLGFVAGQKPEWGAGEYHFYLPEGTTTGANARLYLSGRRAQGGVTTVYVHGNALAGTGTQIFPPAGTTATIDAVTAQNSPTNQALTVQCNAIPISWTASNLLTTVGVALRRIRMTSGANIGGTMYAKEDVGGGSKQARMSYPAVANTYSGTTFLLNPATFTPGLGDSFIIETIPTVSITTDIDPSINIVTDSCQVSLQANTPCTMIIDKGQMFGSTTQGSIAFASSLTVNGTRFNGTTSTNTFFVPSRFWEITNCDFDGFCQLESIVCGNATRIFINGLSGVCSLLNATHSLQSTTNSRHFGWNVLSMGITNVPNAIPFNIHDNVSFTSTTEVWGSGNAFAPLNLKAGARLQWPAPDIFGGVPPASYFYINAAIWISCDQPGGNGNTAPAYDTATNTFTAARRNLSAANLSATVGAGGFNGRFFDPVTCCAMIAAQQG